MEEEAANLDLEDLNLLLRNMPPKVDAEQVRLCAVLVRSSMKFPAPEEVHVVTKKQNVCLQYRYEFAGINLARCDESHA